MSNVQDSVVKLKPIPSLPYKSLPLKPLQCTHQCITDHKVLSLAVYCCTDIKDLLIIAMQQVIINAAALASLYVRLYTIELDTVCICKG